MNITMHRSLLVCALTLAAALRAEDVSVTLPFTPDDCAFTHTPAGIQLTLRAGVLPPGPAGEPWLPARDVMILVPSGARVTALEVTAAQERIIQRDILLAPRQPEAPLSKARPAFVPADPAIYAGATPLPVAHAELTGVHTMRGFTYASVRVWPLRYTPAQRTLTLTETITLRLSCVRPYTPTILPAGRVVNNRHFLSFVRDQVVNPAALDLETYAPRRAALAGPSNDYLIITANALTGAFATLAQQRTTFSGMACAIETTERIAGAFAGRDLQEKIRACIQSYVQTKGTLFVVLGGDDTIVPDRNTHVFIGVYNEPAMPTDLYYSGLDGTWDDCNTNNIFGEADVDGNNAHDEGDLAPDVFVGRIPVRTAAQARDYIDKVCAFESQPPTTVALRMLVGGVSLWDAYSGSDRPVDALNDGLPQFQAHAPVTDAEMWGRRMYRDGVQPFWQAMPPCCFFDSITSWDGGTAGGYPLSKVNFVARLNEGWQLCSFDTHGSPDGWSLESDWFSAADAAALTNAPRLIYTMACNTGAFDTDEPCLSEAFLRNPKGALVYLGCSRYGWGGPDDPPASPVTFGGSSSAYEMEFHRQLFSVRRTTLGEAFAWHKAAKASACGDNYAYRWVQFGLNFQGDPALRLPLDVGVHFDGLDPATPLDATHAPGTQTPLAFWLKNEDLVTHAATVTLATSTAAITLDPTTLVFSAIAGGARVSNAAPVTLSIASDCAAGAAQLALVCASGAGARTAMLALVVAPQPAVGLTDTNIVLVCPPGACVTATLALANAGSAPLSWQCAAGSNYCWRDSRMPGGPAFAWIPVAPDATRILVGDDDVAAPVALPLPFYFYGRRCTNVYIGSNGALGFAPGFLDGNNQALPCLPFNGFGPMLAPLWDDLDPGSAGAIWLQSSSTQLVVSFVGVPRLDYAAQQQTFQAVLEADGRMRLHYLDLRGNLSNATIGVQEAHAGRTLQIAYNTPYLTNALAVELAPPALPAWLALAQTHGTVDAGSTATLQLVVCAAALTNDYEHTTLYLWHNDAQQANCTPLSVTVVLPEPAVVVCLGWLMAGVCVRRRAIRNKCY